MWTKWKGKVRAPNSTHGMINKFTYKRRNPSHSFWILIRILWIMKNTNMCSKLMGARSNQWKSLRTILKSYKLRDNQNLTIMIITRLIRIMRRPYRIRSGGNWARRSRLRCSRQLYCRHTRDRAQYHRWTKLSCSPLATKTWRDDTVKASDLRVQWVTPKTGRGWT
jgi:hypothetical protein